MPLSYALGGLGSSLLTTLFSLFGVVFFTNVIKLNSSYFYSGHVLYALWNAVNDPLFGWLIDRLGNRAHRRIPVIKYGGPLWAICFMCTWYPWSLDGESYIAAAHFIFSMFCFDGFLTFVLIVQVRYLKLILLVTSMSAFAVRPSRRPCSRLRRTGPTKCVQRMVQPTRLLYCNKRLLCL